MVGDRRYTGVDGARECVCYADALRLRNAPDIKMCGCAEWHSCWGRRMQREMR